MALRCFLFSSDEGASDLIRQVLTALSVEAESCTNATAAAESLTREVFQIVVIDWDQQPEAGMLLAAARERKASERPLALAIVSDDASVSKALQGGANSILKKPLSLNAVTDTLTTARDLLRSRQEVTNAQAAAAGAAAAPSVPQPGSAPSLRAGEFLQSAPAAPGGQFETDSEVAHFPEQSATETIDQLKDLEPMAAPVPALPPPPPDEPRGLEWYLKARGVTRQPAPVMAPPAPNNEKPELLGYDQTPSSSSKSETENEAQPSSDGGSGAQAQEHRQEAQLFSYITGESTDSSEGSQPRSRLGKRAIIAALVLAACAVVAAPQAPWHPKLTVLVARGRRTLHGWLNPQPVTAVTQAPVAHEDFGRAGDEYKLPVAETIPDATTDPSQINVVPVVDPTAKKPAPDPAGSTPSSTTPDASSSAPTDPSQPAVVDPSVNPVQTAPETSQPAPSPGPSTPVATPEVAPHSETPATSPSPVASAPAPQISRPAPHPEPAESTPVTPKVPSSLKSQMATMVPEASGNKPLEAALPSIEPVEVPELTERTLVADQPPIPYPASAAGKQGTVTLQVLIGRDGTVQDAVFLQGSLAFARAAIAGVKRWKFKPYSMNGRPVSVQTNLTLKFAPGQ